jgi:predicted phage-related endonuclease
MERDSDVGRLGGHWIAAAIGWSEWDSPLSAYLRITGEVVDAKEESEDLDRGNFLEPALRAWYGKKIGASDVSKPGSTWRHPSIPWASVSPDAIAVVNGETRLGEFKSPGPHTVDRWGAEGTDQVPRDVLLQGVWGLYVTGLPRCDFAALIGGKLKIFQHVRDIELEREVVQRATHFMDHHVAKKIPPAPTYSEADTEWVKKKWKVNAKPPVPWSELTTEEQRLVSAYLAEYQDYKIAEKRVQEMENIIKMDIVKDRGGIDGDNTTGLFKRIAWQSNATGPARWKEIAEAIAKTFGMSEEQLSGLAAKHCGDPARPFRPWFGK